MTFKVPIGISDYRKLRESGAYYVDKTQLITDVVSTPSEVVLLPRPRRFGKTLNLSTARYFFEKSAEDRHPLFEGMRVWESAEARQHFGRHPVIAMTFKDVKAATAAEAIDGVRRVIADAYREHRYLIEQNALPAEEAEAFVAVLRGEASAGTYQTALRDLSRQLASHHGQQAVILIDEYDTPIHAGFTYGYFDEITLFFRNFLSGGLKDNPHLYRGVLTGILRVAKESIFSGLNNVAVHGVLSARFSTAFGFTEEEVGAIVTAMGRPELFDDIRRWYDGYRFAGNVIYNPWSVLNFAGQPEDGLRPYWVFTSSEDALRGLVLENGHAVLPELTALLAGGSVTKNVEEQIVLRELKTNPNAIWSLLLHSGYLTAKEVRIVEGEFVADLVVPNEELRYVYRKSIVSWVEAGLGGAGRVAKLWRAMLEGDEEAFGDLLSELVVRTLSFHDVGGREPERVYQAFVLGMLVDLPRDYEVRSNRESGYGRYDVMVVPRASGRSGVVLEFKQLRESETVDSTLDAALSQIATRRYVEELAAAGASPVHSWGVVFDGKRVWVRKASS